AMMMQMTGDLGEQPAQTGWSLPVSSSQSSGRECREQWLPCVSAIMQHLTARLHRVAMSDLPVLICGEPGRGKSLLARQVHRDTGRRDAPLVVLAGATARAEVVDHWAQQAQHTVLLEEIGDLQSREQTSLIRLLDIPGLPSRLITTTSHNVHDLVTRRRLH